MTEQEIVYLEKIIVVARAAMYLNDLIEDNQPLDLPIAVQDRYNRLRKALEAAGMIRI